MINSMSVLSLKWGRGELGGLAELDARATFRWPAASSIYIYMHIDICIYALETSKTLNP